MSVYLKEILTWKRVHAAEDNALVVGVKFMFMAENEKRKENGILKEKRLGLHLYRH
jgi:hypothetical protein